MTPLERKIFGMASFVVFAILAVSFLLNPSKKGYGTHEQLGLPPCTFLMVTGIPCPSCGMTTSFSHVMHGDLLSAWKTNWPGTVIACCCVIFIPWSIMSIYQGRFLGIKKPELFFLIVTLTLLTVTLLHWFLLYAGWY